MKHLIKIFLKKIMACYFSLNYKQIHVVTKNFCKGRYIDIMYMFMTFVNSLAVVLVTFTVLYELPCIKSNNVVSEQA